jgi:hypothetical protein
MLLDIRIPVISREHRDGTVPGRFGTRCPGTIIEHSAGLTCFLVENARSQSATLIQFTIPVALDGRRVQAGNIRMTHNRRAWTTQTAAHIQGVQITP